MDNGLIGTQYHICLYLFIFFPTMTDCCFFVKLSLLESFLICNPTISFFFKYFIKAFKGYSNTSLKWRWATRGSYVMWRWSLMILLIFENLNLFFFYFCFPIAANSLPFIFRSRQIIYFIWIYNNFNPFIPVVIQYTTYILHYLFIFFRLSYAYNICRRTLGMFKLIKSCILSSLL